MQQLGQARVVQRYSKHDGMRQAARLLSSSSPRTCTRDGVPSAMEAVLPNAASSTAHPPLKSYQASVSHLLSMLTEMSSNEAQRRENEGRAGLVKTIVEAKQCTSQVQEKLAMFDVHLENGNLVMAENILFDKSLPVSTARFNKLLQHCAVKVIFLCVRVCECVLLYLHACVRVCVWKETNKQTSS